VKESVSDSVLPPTKPFEDRRLPEALEQAHAVCVHLVDEVTALVRDGQRAGYGSVGFAATEEQRAHLESLSGDALWEWMGANGLSAERDELAFRQLVLALASDFSSFLLEALICAGKSKMTVAFSLLRKPLKENLLILEWLLTDRVGFLERFHGTGPAEYAWRALDQPSRAKVVESALDVVGLGHLDAAFLHDLRYSKQAEWGLERLWQQATHLVTTFRGLETEPGNLNFVFSDQDQLAGQQAGFYTLLLLPLYAGVSIIEALFAQSGMIPERKLATDQLVRALAVASISDAVPSHDDIVGEIAQIAGSPVSLACASCTEPLRIEGPNFHRFWSSFQLLCSCGSVNSCWDRFHLEGTEAETRPPPVA